MLHSLARIGCLLAASLLCAVTAAADPTSDAARLEFFEKRIRPILVQSCYECHAGENVKGGLRLDSRHGVQQGGESGTLVVPGKPDESLIIEALRYESLEMPPKNPLPDEVIADFVKWIETGAIDPREQADSSTAEASWQTILAARRDWWSLQAISDPPVPRAGADWAKRPLDHFIADKLDEAGLTANPPAAPETLIRRLSLVLTGLPPTWHQVRRFCRDFEHEPEAAYRTLVDRLLASPHFGERWARHWMDVVRFSETHGNEWNYEVHHAWRYRSYLIRALNSDVPFDRFVLEHIAGDLIAPRWNRVEEINESLIGTSFYRFGEVNHDDCVTLTAIGYDILDNQIDTLTKAFQATTVACARCHDHKIDAVSMQDYYAILGILKSSRPTAHTIDAGSVNAKPSERLRELKPLIREEVASLWKTQLSDLSQYLLAADAQHREDGSASSLAAGLDPQRLQNWVAAMKIEGADPSHPIHPWQRFTAADDPALEWKKLSTEYAAAQQENQTFNRARFQSFGEFHPGANASSATDWRKSGQGLQEGTSRNGDFTVATDGATAIAQVLPAGTFTHHLSEKLNGTLRSPMLPTGWKHISLQVLGNHTSAARLVSNNCQLNYANYRALTSPQPTWVTFPIPDDAQALNTFAELITKFDNPKFPDQLGTLGGDTRNDRIPWPEAAADPRSYFGIMQAVLHNDPAPPRNELAHVSRLFEETKQDVSRNSAADRYAGAIRAAVDAWSNDTATDADVAWLSWVVDHDLLDQSLGTSRRLGDLVNEYRRVEASIRPPRLAVGISDGCNGDGYDHPLLERGDYRQPGEPVPRRYLEVLERSSDANRFIDGSGRLQLAEAIASPDNPLTARVIVNRVWHHLFGTGIVRTVDDFGRVGELPSHPELLDYLATRFATSSANGGMGWSLKQLIRELALSQTFRASSRADPTGMASDPLNRLLHHYPARRMEAETIRDSILQVAGDLDRQLFGMSIQPFRDKPNHDRRLFAGPLDGDRRRSLYIKINLMEGPAFLGSFNIPGGKLTQGRRDVTNVPTQALTLLNDRFVLQQAEVWGRQLVAVGADSVESRIESMLREALGRHLEPSERDAFAALVAALARQYQVADDEILSSEPIWRDVAHVLFNLKEFIYIP